MRPTLLHITWAVTVTIFLLAASAAHAQTPGTGAISGIVSDPQNRPVNHAEILAENESTHIVRSANTTAEGDFRIPLLSPGTYTLTVSAPGFTMNATHAVEVTVSETRSLPDTTSQSLVVPSPLPEANTSQSGLNAIDETA